MGSGLLIRIAGPALALLLAAAAVLGSFARVQAPRGEATRPDLLIRGGTVVDGSGAPRFRADVATKGDRIVRVDRGGIAAESSAQVLDAQGLIVAPGFIDNHAHIATNIHEYPLAENFLRQGITTILASLHSGASAVARRPAHPWPSRRG